MYNNNTILESTHSLKTVSDLVCFRNIIGSADASAMFDKDLSTYDNHSNAEITWTGDLTNNHIYIKAGLGSYASSMKSGTVSIKDINDNELEFLNVDSNEFVTSIKQNIPSNKDVEFNLILPKDAYKICITGTANLRIYEVLHSDDFSFK